MSFFNDDSNWNATTVNNEQYELLKNTPAADIAEAVKNHDWKAPSNASAIDRQIAERYRQDSD